jgi:signal transduction histidine kinase
MTPDLYIRLTFLAGASFTAFGILVYIKNRRDLSVKIFGLLAVSFAVWIFSWFVAMLTKTEGSALFWSRMLNFGATWIPAFFLHWVILLLGLDKKLKKSLIAVYTFIGGISLFGFSSLYIENVRKIEELNIYWPVPGPLFIWFIMLGYGVVVSYAFYEIIRNFKNLNKENKIQVVYLAIGSFLGFGGGATNFLFMYSTSKTTLAIALVGMFAVAITPYFFTYAAVKYRFMNFKTIGAEIFGGVIVLVLLIKTLGSKSTNETILNSVLLLTATIFAVLLMKSVNREVKQKEELQKITKELAAANEELKRVDAAKSEFVSIVSHQLRTPLTAVKGYISMMQEGTYGKMEENQLGVLEKVFQSSERLIAFINDLLNLNRIEEGRIIYSFSSVDLAQMADDIVFDLKTLADLKKLSLTWLKPHGLPKAWADPDKVRQVMINFIDNSIKYTAEGSVNVTLKLEGDYIIFQVKDTGVGMNPEEKSNLFKKFVRGEGGRTMHTGGTGLGLYVAKLMAEAHKGEIMGESEGKGKGSTFTIKIPTEDFAKKNNINQQESKQAQTPVQPTQSPPTPQVK